MKKSIVNWLYKTSGAVCLLLAVGCAQSSESEIYQGKIADWQRREQAVPAIASTCPSHINPRFDIVKVLKEVGYSFELMKESGDYWKTSSEAFESQAGDCEDAAALAYRALSDSCLVERYGLDVRMRVLDSGKNKTHTVAIVYADSGEFYEISNLILQAHESTKEVVAEFTAFDTF